MNLLALTKYPRVGPSSRLRFFQFTPYLESEGIIPQVEPLVSTEYIHQLFSSGRQSPAELLKGYIHRSRLLARIKQFDLLWIEKELFPWIPIIEQVLLSTIKKPFVVDYDDAVFHLYDLHPIFIIRRLLKTKIANLMGMANYVTVGNDYLKRYAQRAGARHIRIIPTVVDTNRYTAMTKPLRKFTIGWIGTPVTQSYLMSIRNILKILSETDDVQITLVGASDDALQELNPVHIAWNENTEVDVINGFDVGIMPLDDDPFSKGKCGYKLIQCMACGIPVVASPVGSNNAIIDHGENGFLTHTQEDWLYYLQLLKKDRKLRENMGRAARQKVLSEFSLTKAAPLLSQVLFDALR